MSDSNGNGTLKRARSSSPVNGGAGNSSEDRQQGTGKKQNTGRGTGNASGSAGSPNTYRGTAATSTGAAMSDSNGPAASTARSNDVSQHATEAVSNSQAASAGDNATADQPAPQITIKALIVTQDASIIIGKGGVHIKEIRERAGARVSVSDQLQGNPERILNVMGPLDAVSKAYGLIVRKINDEPYDQPSLPGSRAVTIKYIIPNSRMGSVIGKGGAKIKEIQEASGAKLQASEAMLAGSTERVLSVSGVADAIHIAVYYVGTILQEGQERQPNIPYRPSAAGYAPAAPYAAPSRHSGPSSSASSSSYYPHGGAPYGQSPAGYPGGPPSGMAPSSGGYQAGGAGAGPPTQTQQIYIPNDLVGNIIGKGGQKINEIRQLSQCNIKIMESGDSQGTGARPGERLVSITGLPHNIQTAVQMLHSRLESERQRKVQGGGTAAY